MIYYDYHMHCNYSADSQAPMEDMIEKSIELGLKEICFTDHVDYDVLGNPNVKVDYDKYFEDIDFYNNKYKDKISIKKGIEMGLQTQVLERCSKEIKETNFDFVIGSIHTIDRNELFTGDFHKGKTQHEAYEGYYKSLLEIVNSYDDYSALGHVDLIKRYGNYDTILKDEIFSDYLEAILKKVIYSGKGIEINTSSFRYNLPDLTPSKNILKMYKDLGGEILTIGSDSHNPTQIATKFDYIHDALGSMGYKYICKFNNMKPEFIKL
ncbi:histidinol-phosphatase HisJ family protein [Clostridium botulinum]|uniref:histidinol-phosphatase HisJ family protein n=1 Tax=Clostridium botulinum TaxID=1491 RepID=UPI0013FA24C3|nr:histidinol-phosphatase HisJ family protein [Clostridium botulinum]MBN1065977.1 PHP domain-containing protein [Clostridium botulinum]NFO55460.1 histidinol-phosphatase HisJ family protein [Clostridium botulinum]